MYKIVKCAAGAVGLGDKTPTPRTQWGWGTTVYTQYTLSLYL